MKMVLIKHAIGIVIVTTSLTGCAMDNMTPTQQALLVGSAAAAAGGIAYGIHQKHKADKAEHEQHDHHSDDSNAYHARHHHHDSCHDGDGHWQC